MAGITYDYLLKQPLFHNHVVPYILIGPTAPRFRTDGTNDGATIQAAHDALPAVGGRLILQNATYNFDSSSDRVFITKSNVFLEGESAGGVTFKATQSLHPGGSDANGRYGILTVGKNNNSLISNILIKNITIDCNNVSRTAGLTLDGGGGSGSIGLQKVRCESVTVTNFGSSSADSIESGGYIMSGLVTGLGNRGYVDDVAFLDCEFKNSNKHGFWLLGGHISNLLFEKCKVLDNNNNGINVFTYDLEPNSNDWVFLNCRFERNMILTSAGSQGHYRDSTQVGVNRLSFLYCYFGEMQNPDTNSDFCVTPYWSGDCRIEHCMFDRVGLVASWGASVSGSYAKIFPITRLFFNDNIVFRSRATFDDDSNVFATFRGNIFYEVKRGEIIGMYSRHFPSVIADNIVYNCQVDNDGSEEERQKSAFRVAGDGVVVRDNYIIDDRKLIEPVSNVSLSQVAGGSLGTRTYFVKYTWANSTGETLPSSQVSLTVNSNNLLKVSVGFSYIPSGATELKIYVSTTSGSELHQATIDLPDRSLSWTEPTTGLVSGDSLPGSNTTHTKTKYGIYEVSGGASGGYGNFYSDNYMIGIETPILMQSSYKRIRYNNYVDNTYNQTGDDVIEDQLKPFDQGSVSGTVTISPINGLYTKLSLTGNVTTLNLTAGDYIGQEMLDYWIQDGTGSRTISWPSNFKKAGGALTLSIGANAIDVVRRRWDGTNWIEMGRSLNIG